MPIIMQIYLTILIVLVVIFIISTIITALTYDSYDYVNVSYYSRNVAIISMASFIVWGMFILIALLWHWY